MTEFERAVIVLLDGILELVQTSAKYHASLPDEEAVEKLPERVTNLLHAVAPEAAEIIETADLRPKRKRAAK